MSNNKDTPTKERPYHRIEKVEVECSRIGKINVYVRLDEKCQDKHSMSLSGVRKSNEVVIMTVHDLGCDHTMYDDFIDNPKMAHIRGRAVWVHVIVPGQGKNAPDLPTAYHFPRMQTIGEDLIHVVDQLNIKQVVCLGEGAGANIIVRFAMENIERVLGVCLLHTTGTTAGFMNSLQDKMISWKLERFGMNPSAESYLVLHRFGGVAKAKDCEQLNACIHDYQESLRHSTNIKNLKKFVEAFLKRSNVADNIKKLKCPVLLVTGQKSLFNETTRTLHHHILKTCEDKSKVNFIEVADVANVIEERPEKLAECFQYFLQGLGLVSSVPLQHQLKKTSDSRSMSMEEYDKPLRNRTMSVGSGTSSGDGIPTSPPNSAGFIPPSSPLAQQ